MNELTTIAGWIGTILILAAYFLVSSRKIKPTSSAYQLLNLFGALGVLLNTLVNKAWPAVSLQIAWSLIALVALISILKGRKTTKKRK